jgi:DNA-binding beta-propeller fold protein YncE
MKRDIVLTAKNDRRVEFYDGATHARLAALDMPAPVHELALTPDGATAFGSVFGGGVFGKNKDPDHRLVVIDIASRSIDGFIDTGACLAPHGMMFGNDGLLWVTAELNNALLGVDVRARRVVHEIDIGGAAHWVVAHPDGRRLYASCKQTPNVAVIDLATRRVAGQITIANRCEGMAMAADGEFLYVASHVAPEINVIDTKRDRVVKSLRFEGAGEDFPQLRRARLSPDRRWLLVSSSKDRNVAVFRLPSLEQTALIAVGKAPMGFAFPEAPDRALVCNHDDGVVTELDLANGVALASFTTGSGCEYAEYFAAA